MANSGRAEEALEFYYRALDLNPVYIRARLLKLRLLCSQQTDQSHCRYNLGISCINLKVYTNCFAHSLRQLIFSISDITRALSTYLMLFPSKMLKVSMMPVA